MLQGKRFVRIHPGVWRHVDHEMTHEDWIEAARLALPSTARTTGLTRLQQLGLDFGPRLPVRYVIQGDHHLAFDGIFLHRTKLMPPTGEVGATPTAAFVACCAHLRLIDAIQIGDWLLHRGHMTSQSRWRTSSSRSPGGAESARHRGSWVTWTATLGPSRSRRSGH